MEASWWWSIIFAVNYANLIRQSVWDTRQWRKEWRVVKYTSPASYYLKAGFVKWQSKHPERNAATIMSESANFLSLCISENAYLVITKTVDIEQVL